MEESVEETISLVAWQLFYISEALTRAKKLEALRQSFQQELYLCIIPSSASLDPLNPSMISSATDTQAIRIVEAKDRYDRRILKEYDNHVRWKQLLNFASESDRIILVYYFQKKRSFRPEIISDLLHRIKDRVSEEDDQLENLRSEKALKEYRKIRSLQNRIYKKKRMVQFYEDGAWLAMYPEQYREHQQKKAEERKREEWKQRMARLQKRLVSTK